MWDCYVNGMCYLDTRDDHEVRQLVFRGKT